MASPAARVGNQAKAAGLNAELEGQWVEPFYFIQGADCQLGFNEKGGNADWSEDRRLLDQAVRAVNSLDPQPRFMVICGDLGNAFPHEDEYADQVVAVNAELLKIDCPCCILPGNHDTGNECTPEGVRAWIASYDCPDYYSFWCGGVFFCVLNSMLFWEDSREEVADREAQEAWLRASLEAACQRDPAPVHVIFFQHISLFLFEADEVNDYFNVDVEQRARLVSLCDEFGVRAVFAGHYHRNTVVEVERDDGSTFSMVTTSAIGRQLGRDKSGLQIVRVYEDDIAYEYVALASMPHTVSLDREEAAGDAGS